MQKIFNILFGLAVIWLIQTSTAEYAFTVLLFISPYHIVFNR